jgi:uncharacterized protein (DUF1499 family)
MMVSADEKRRHAMTIDRQRTLILLILAGILSACAGERPDNPGMRDNVLAACPASPNCVSSRAADEGHRIAPLAFTGEPDKAFARLKEVITSRSDATVTAEKPGYLQVELRTTFFVDDAVFLLDRQAGVIQVRSASRLGYSDLGKNRSRMEEIRSQFTRAGENP